MDWEEEPATNQQLFQLKEYGFVPTCPLTVTQAARLIRQYRQHGGRPPMPLPAPIPPAPARSPTLARAVAPEPPRSILPIRRGLPGPDARTHAFRLRVAVEDARKAAAENPDRPGVKADLHAAISAREQFWRDTCRDARDLQAVGPEAMEFYQHYGAGFFTPTWEEVGEVLNALDRARPGWDKDHPELYYETLKLNYPSLLRHR